MRGSSTTPALRTSTTHEAVKKGGHVPARRKRVVQAPVVAETATAATNGTVVVIDPATVRPRLAEAAAESVDELRRVLVETATSANEQL